MAKLIYAAITSLDGYIEDANGSFDWSAPDHEVHAFVNDLERSIGTYLYGRRMYETMVYWETAPTSGETDEAVVHDYARIWQAADKVVYSTTLADASSTRTQIERSFDPDAVAQRKETAERDISVGGSALAAEAFRAGLIDELHLFLSPVVVGGGKAALPDGVRLQLALLDERRFANGTVYVQYRVVS
jgi:dihydrofolate reductase